MVSGKNTSLIAKNLANQCASDELSELGHWLDSGSRSRNLYYQYQLVWKLTGIASTQLSFDDENAWQNLQERINKFEKQATVFRPASPKGIRFVPFLARVAAVLVLVLAGWYMFKPEAIYEPEIITLVADQANSEEVMLPDGTNIMLNKGSKLDYTEGYNIHHRKVNFEGEAFFEVNSDADYPFIISTSNLLIKVLGTSFNLLSMPHQEDVVLYLKTGKVQVSSIDQDGEVLEQIIASAGDKVVFDKSEGLLVRDYIKDQNFIAWKTGILEFSNAPLKEVLEALEKTYSFNFVLEHNCSNFLLTARFENETPESIFQTLELVFNLDIQQLDDQILIR